MRTLELYFNDLTPEAQKKYLKVQGVSDASELNWEVNPITIIEVEEEPIIIPDLGNKETKMSHHRFTLKEIKDLSDSQFLTILLNEREGGCTNIYAPLTKRIRATRLRLETGNLTGYTLAQYLRIAKDCKGI